MTAETPPDLRLLVYGLRTAVRADCGAGATREAFKAAQDAEEALLAAIAALATPPGRAETPQASPAPSEDQMPSVRDVWAAIHATMDSLGVKDKAPLVVAITHYGEVRFRQGCGAQAKGAAQASPEPLREALAGRLYEAHRRAEGRAFPTPWADVAAHYSTTRDEWLAVADVALAASPEQRDTKRLDWLEAHPREGSIRLADGTFKMAKVWAISADPKWSIREAIDAAMAPG